MAGFYNRALASAHAAGFSDLSLSGGALVLNALHHTWLHAGTILDLGCGSGEWVHLAVARGYEAVAVDVSEDMAALARSRVPSAQFVTGSLWDYDIAGPFVAVTALGEALTYGTPELPTIADLAALFARVSRALVPGGVFVFDVIVPGDAMQYRNWTEIDGHTILVDVDEDTASATLTRSIVVFTRDPDGHTWRRSDERHVVRVYEQHDIEQALASAGLTWTTTKAYGDVALGPRRLAFLARR